MSDAKEAPKRPRLFDTLLEPCYMACEAEEYWDDLEARHERELREVAEEAARKAFNWAESYARDADDGKKSRAVMAIRTNAGLRTAIIRDEVYAATIKARREGTT